MAAKLMVAVRFAPDAVARVKRLAAADGVTVSAWMRRLIAREIKARASGTADVAAYPWTRTEASSQMQVQLDVQFPPTSSWTGS